MALDIDRVNNILDAVHGVDTLVEPTLPLSVRLMRINGSATAPGTEVTPGAGGGAGAGYATGGAEVDFAAAADGAATLVDDAVWVNMPVTTVAGVEVWDDAAVPLRWTFGAFNPPIVLASGGSLTLTPALFASTLS